MEILRFTASWCQPCKALAMQLTELELNDSVTVIDIDEQSNLAIKHGVRSVPTMVMLENGKEVKRIVGVYAKDILLDWFQKDKQ
jgi:thioredoxin 1